MVLVKQVFLKLRVQLLKCIAGLEPVKCRLLGLSLRSDGLSLRSGLSLRCDSVDNILCYIFPGPYRSTAECADIIELAGLLPYRSDHLDRVNELVAHLHAVLVDGIQHIAGVEHKLRQQVKCEIVRRLGFSFSVQGAGKMKHHLTGTRISQPALRGFGNIT